jgi:hypothetical protein
MAKVWTRWDRASQEPARYFSHYKYSLTTTSISLLQATTVATHMLPGAVVSEAAVYKL